jgi:hypothetical protein
MAKIRFYKYVTPPSTGGKGITVIIDGKKVTQPTDGAVKNIKAINSLGATTNSIGVVMEDMTTSMKGFMSTYMRTQEQILNLREDHIDDEKKRLKDASRAKKRAEGLEQDKKAEDLQEGKRDKKSTFGKKSKKVAAGAFGFFKGLASLFTNLFRTLVMYEILDWFSKPENLEKIKKMLEAIKAIGTWLKNTYGFLINMGLDGIVAFMENPFSFQGVFGILKFITALGLIFAPAAVAKLGLGLLFKLMGSLGSKGLANAVFGFMGKLGMAVFNVMKGVVSFLVGTGWGWTLGTIAGIGALGIALGNKANTPGVEKGKTELDETSENGGMVGAPMSGDMFSDEGLDEKADGGKVKKKAAGGGWITGPMSGYPVSLDGGASTSFIGHGTEWVGRRSAGGDAFVIPFNTPATSGGRNGLTSLRMQQAKAGGYTLPSFAKGGTLSNTKNPRRDGSQEENRLAGMESLRKLAQGGKIFLHWTAGGGNFKQSGKYHSIVQGDGSIYRAHPYDQRSGVAHTYLRNGEGIGMALAAMAGSAGNYVWPSGKQISAMSGEIADIAKKRGWKESDINVKNIMTHAEAASGKDGKLPGNDNYGPTAWGGDGARWDLWHLTKDGEKGSGGHIIRNQVRKMLGMKQIPVPPDAGSPNPAKAAASKGSTKNNATNTNNQSGSSEGSTTNTFDPTSSYLSAEKMAAFFTGSAGLIGDYAADAKEMATGGNLNLGISGPFCPWCKSGKKYASGGVYAPVLDLIAREESRGKWDAMAPGKTLPGATDMTIAQVAAKATGAVGKWQNLPRYLVARAKAVGLDPMTAKYNAENQTKIAVHLIEKGQAGVTPAMMKDNPQEAMIRLARVWAAVPVPKDMQGHRRAVKKGESYYAGVGSNAAHIKVDEMMKALGGGGYPKFDANKKYATGDIVNKDGKLRIFDGMGWGDYEGSGPTAQGTANDTQVSANTGGVSVDPVTGGETEHGEKKKNPMEALMGKMDILKKYVQDAQEMGSGTPSSGLAAGIDESNLRPRSGDQLAAKQKAEDAAKAEAGENVSLTSTQLPAAGGNSSPPQQIAAEVDMPASGPYVIPANAYARPRFGLTAEIFAEPVSIA